MDEPRKFGGSRFEVSDFDRLTVLQYCYLQKVLRQIGADQVLPMEGEGDDIYVARLHVCIVDSLKAPDLVAGILVPVGKAWSPEIAKATTKHVAALQTEADIELVLQLAMDVVLGFFKRGVESWLRLQSYGTSASASEAAPSEQSDQLH